MNKYTLCIYHSNLHKPNVLRHFVSRRFNPKQIENTYFSEFVLKTATPFCIMNLIPIFCIFPFDFSLVNIFCKESIVYICKPSLHFKNMNC